MEKNHNRNWWIKLWIIIGSISAILISSIVVVIFFFFFAPLSSSSLFLKANFLGLDIVEKNVASIKVNESINNNVIDNENDPEIANKVQDNFLLGTKGLEIMKNKIQSRLGFGPEFFALKQIVFMEGQKKSLIDQSANGVYYPNTQQIIINTSQLVNSFKNDWEKRADFFDEITEMLFQVLYHEYGHHKANTYLLNVYPKNFATLTSDEIYHQTNSNREVEPWNKYFVDNFKDYLTYDKDEQLYKPDEDVMYKNIFNQDQPYKVDITYNNQTKKAINVKSIGSIYNAKTLFERANGKSQPQYQEVIDMFNSPSPRTIAFSPTQVNLNHPLNLIEPNDFEILSYYYCLQELFTRKYMQLTFPYKTNVFFDSEGWIGEKYPTTYLDDTLKYQSMFNSDENSRFLSDAPLKSDDVANGLINTFHNLNGQNNNTNLSLIWQNNTSSYIEKNNMIKGIPADEKKSKQIKFGGFLTPEQITKNYKYIGYFNDEINHDFKAVKINTLHYDFNRVDKLGINETLPLQNGSQNFYVTSQWLNGENINGKDLYFATDDHGENFEPLLSVLDPIENHALATSNRFYPPLSLNNSAPFFQGEIEDNKVKIKQYQR